MQARTLSASSRHGVAARTIRTIDPPRTSSSQARRLMVEMSTSRTPSLARPKLKELRTLLARVEELHEQNPCSDWRLPPRHRLPEITEMSPAISRPLSRQLKAESASEIMIRVGFSQEMRNQGHRSPVAEESSRRSAKSRIHGGTMIELPARPHRRPDRKGRVLQLRHPTTYANHFGISPDDINQFLPPT